MRGRRSVRVKPPDRHVSVDGRWRRAGGGGRLNRSGRLRRARRGPGCRRLVGHLHAGRAKARAEQGGAPAGRDPCRACQDGDGRAARGAHERSLRAGFDRETPHESYAPPPRGPYAGVRRAASAGRDERSAGPAHRGRAGVPAVRRSGVGRACARAARAPRDQSGVGTRACVGAANTGGASPRLPPGEAARRPTAGPRRPGSKRR